MSGGVERSGAHRQLDRNCGSGADAACQEQRAAVQLDDDFGERKSQSGALMLSIKRRTQAMKRPHHIHQHFRLHADAAIGNANRQPTVPNISADAHLAAGRRELHGIVNKIDERLPELRGIAAIGRASADQLPGFFLGKIAQALDRAQQMGTARIDKVKRNSRDGHPGCWFLSDVVQCEGPLGGGGGGPCSSPYGPPFIAARLARRAS